MKIFVSDVAVLVEVLRTPISHRRISDEANRMGSETSRDIGRTRQPRKISSLKITVKACILQLYTMFRPKMKKLWKTIKSD